MSANIFRYYGREIAWHKLGTTFEEGTNPDLVEAFTQGKLNYEFTLSPVWGVPDGQYVEFEGKRMVVRNPTTDDPFYRPIDIVTEDYSLVQNMEIADAFNNLSKRWRVETVGALGKGETIFVTLDCGMVEIGGEEVHRFFILTDNKTGLKKTSILYAPIQVVCQNTLRLAFEQSSLTVSIKHVKGNKEKLLNIASIAEALDEKSKAIDTLFGGMVKMPFSLAEFNTLVEKVLYPIPEPEEGIDVTEAFVKMREKAVVEQNAVKDLYEEYAETRPGLAENKFGAYSVISDYEGFVKPGRGNSRYQDYIFGKRGDKVAWSFDQILKAK